MPAVEEDTVAAIRQTHMPTKSGLLIGKIFGIPIYLHASWVIIFVLITVTLQTQFAQEHPQWTTVQPTPMVFQPLFDGGMEWPPAAYSPRTHFVYSHARYSPINISITNSTANAECPTGQLGETRVSTCEGAFGGSVPGVNHGVYGAVNPTTGKVAWTIPTLTTTPDSGMTVAGDLVFFGDSTGLFYAASAATGEILWVFDAFTVPGAGGAAASAAIYEINGVEYVVYGFGGEPGKSFALGDAVIAFALPSALAAAAKTGAADKALAQRARVR